MFEECELVCTLTSLSSKSTSLNFMAPFYYGWGSTASRLQPFRGGSLLFTIQFPEIPGTSVFSIKLAEIFLSFLSLLLKLLPIKSRRWKSDMKKYFINQFSISCFKKMSETPLDTQVIFKPYLPQVFRMILKIYKRRYQPQNDHMKHHWIHRNVFLFHQRR